MMYDVNNDGQHSVLDSLLVLNALQKGEQLNELLELQLNALTLDDQPLDSNGNGVIDVGQELDVNERFKLEISYDDLRLFGDAIGAFRVAADIGVSEPCVLRPVLRETHRIRIRDEIRTASSGELTIQIEGNPQIETISLEQIANASPVYEPFRQAMVNLGYDESQLEFSTFRYSNRPDIGIEIRYVDPAFGNVDLPNLIVTSNFDVPVEVSAEDISPFGEDGVSPNLEAIRFNLETASRTFNNGERFYGSLNDGGFTLEDGFDELAGVGGVPTMGGGVGELTRDGVLIEPFDVFAVEVYLASSIDVGTVFSADVNPGESEESLLLYGRDDEIPVDRILVDEDAVVRFQNSGSATPILVAGPVERVLNETDESASIDLLEQARSLLDRNLSVTDVVIAGDSAGVEVSGNTLIVDPASYSDLNRGETATISLIYQVSDGFDSQGCYL